MSHSTTYVYDANNNLIAQTDAAGQTTYYGYDEYGHVISSTNAAGETATYAYDAWGQRTAITDATGLVTRYGYDAVGRLITTTAPTGLVTVNAYDDGDNLIQVTRNYTTAGGQNYQGIYNQVTEYGYDATGRRVLVTDTLGMVTLSVYDGAGRLIRQTRTYSPSLDLDDHGPGAAWNLSTWYSYDALGRQTHVTDTPGSATYTEYDELNRVVRTWRNYLPGSSQNHQGLYNLVTSYGYDAVGNQVWMTDTAGIRTYTQYDALNRPVTVTSNYVDGIFATAHPDEDLVQVTIYDPETGRMVQTVDPAGRVTRQEYDAAGRVVTVTANYVDGIFDAAHPDEDVRQVTVYDPATGRVAARLQVAGSPIPWAA